MLPAVRNLSLIITLMMCMTFPVTASEVCTPLQNDSLNVMSDWQPDSVYVRPDSTEVGDLPMIPKKRNLIGKIIEYFNHTNDIKPEKKFDISVIGGPSYSASTSLELAALVSGLYRTSRDTLTSRSDISLYAQGSVTGFYTFGIQGNHYLPKDKFKIIYDAYFCHFPLSFWGIGYEMESNDDNESDYTLLESALDMQFLWRLSHHTYLGPSANFNYQKATKIERPQLWDGQDPRVFCYGFGLSFNFDTRDLPTNASRGFYVGVRQQFFPRFMGNHYAFSMTDVEASAYHRFWSSGIMAFRIHGAAAYGNPSWGMLPTLDAGNSIRGYYEGRYRDKNVLDAVVELRQHVWRRNGIVLWGGVGSVFSRFNQVKWDTLLPSYGIGYRWEFKDRVNVRVDLGFGKHSSSINFGINEAF